MAAFAVEITEREGGLGDGRFSARILVRDCSTEEVLPFRVEAWPDPASLIRLRACRDATVDHPDGSADGYAAETAPGASPPLEMTVDNLSPEIRSRIVRRLLAKILAREEARFDEIFESSRALIARYSGQEMILPPLFRALASHVIERRFAEHATELSRVPPATLTGPHVLKVMAETLAIARETGIAPMGAPIARVIERAVTSNLGDPTAVRAEDARRSIDLILSAEKAGINIRRTRLEEMVYALLSHHRDALAAKLAGRKVPQRGIDPDVLIHLAEQSNVSLCSFERTPARTP